MPISVVGTFLGIGFMVPVMWPVANTSLLFAWVAVFALITIARAVHALHFLKTEHSIVDFRPWAWQFALGTCAAGLLWAMTSVLLVPKDDVIRQIILSFMLATTCAVAITNISSMLWVVLLFISVVMIPLVMVFLAAKHEYANLMVMLTTLATVLFMLGATRANRSIIENIRYRLEAELSARVLERSQQRLKMHIQRTPLAVIEWDPDLNVTAWNKAAQDMFGYTESEVLGRNGIDLLVPKHAAGQVVDVKDDLSHNQGGLYSVNENITKDGRIILVEWFNTTLIDENSKVIGMASLAHDVTDRVRVEKFKNEFISTVSHELRTPLTSMRGSLGLALGGVVGELNGELKNLVGIAHRNAERLQRLVDDLLDVQGIEDGKLEYVFEDTDLTGLIFRCLDANSGYAHQRHINLRTNCDRGKQIIVHADKSRMLQVLDNLVSNAIKFSPLSGTVIVGLEEFSAMVQIYVRDQGPGISDELRPRIFDRFTQGDGTSTREFAGTGLGLSIAKAIVEEHGGDIGVDNIETGGSRFFVNLPLNRGPEKPGSGTDEHSTEVD
ncbi:MAG: cell wall metabolism sensor histidine kinase WalK [Gammaproteobacteria bacterium]|nr:cell wall metabolism sensor histidine kinase WalK [Gammaproteobacteria bacterium]